jgi:parallel beta-helix repeat protein
MVIYDSNNNIVSFNQLLGTYFIGIFIRGENNTVSENSIWHADDGNYAAGIKIVRNSEFDNNTIFKNRIEYCYIGIDTAGFSSSYIKENIISNCKCGIWLTGGDADIISKNNISYNEVGMRVDGGKNTIVSYNDITYNDVTGIIIDNGIKHEILNNNICWNKINAKNLYSTRIKWDGNYWGETMTFPKIFLGEGRILLYTYLGSYGEVKYVYLYYPKINIDWHPAKKPYDIP